MRKMCFPFTMLACLLAGCAAPQDRAATVNNAAKPDPVADARYVPLRRANTLPATPTRATVQPTPQNRSPAPNNTTASKKTAQSHSQRTYVVRRGDSLYSIARQVYGDERAWRRIFDANRARLTSPDDLEVGDKLILP